MKPQSTIIDGEQGFSLLETVIAMFILALLATTVAKHQVLLLKTQHTIFEQWQADRLQRNQALRSFHS